MITSEEALALAKKFVNGKIEELAKKLFGSSSSIVFYGVCSTPPNTQVKVVSIPEITSLYTGLKIRIRFTENNSYSSTPTLKINDLDAKAINVRYQTSATTYEWQAGAVLDFVFDGTQFIMVNGGHASTTFWGKTKLSSSTSSTSEDLAATPKAVKAAYDLANSAAPKAQLIDVTTPGFSSLPQTFYSSQLTAACKVVGNAVHLSVPQAGHENWSVSFAAGSLTISGTFVGSTATTATMSIWIPGQTITLTSTP